MNELNGSNRIIDYHSPIPRRWSWFAICSCIFAIMSGPMGNELSLLVGQLLIKRLECYATVMFAIVLAVPSLSLILNYIALRRLRNPCLSLCGKVFSIVGIGYSLLLIILNALFWGVLM
jgi:hypothetical protein